MKRFRATDLGTFSWRCENVIDWGGGGGGGKGGGGGCGLPAKTASTSLEGPNVKYWRTPAHSVPELKHDLHFFFFMQNVLDIVCILREREASFFKFDLIVVCPCKLSFKGVRLGIDAEKFWLS